MSESMIDHAAWLAEQAEQQRKQEAARESGHIITIRVERFAGTLLHIDANHPVRVEVEGEEVGWFMAGGAVDRYPGECKIGEVMIDDLAKQGVTELAVGDEDGPQLVIPIPPYQEPNA